MSSLRPVVPVKVLRFLRNVGWWVVWGVQGFVHELGHGVVGRWVTGLPVAIDIGTIGHEHQQMSGRRIVGLTIRTRMRGAGGFHHGCPVSHWHTFWIALGGPFSSAIAGGAIYLLVSQVADPLIAYLIGAWIGLGAVSILPLFCDAFDGWVAAKAVVRRCLERPIQPYRRPANPPREVLSAWRAAGHADPGR